MPDAIKRNSLPFGRLSCDMGKLLVEEQENRCGKSNDTGEDRAIEANEGGERGQ
jgi:hypothetical protein